MFQQAGDSMGVGMIGLAYLWLLLCTDLHSPGAIPLVSVADDGRTESSLSSSAAAVQLPARPPELPPPSAASSCGNTMRPQHFFALAAGGGTIEMQEGASAPKNRRLKRVKCSDKA